MLRFLNRRVWSGGSQYYAYVITSIALDTAYVYTYDGLKLTILHTERNVSLEIRPRRCGFVHMTELLWISAYHLFGDSLMV